MDQVDVNLELWRAGRHVDTYANRTLAPVEVMILVRYRDQLTGRVVEVGCGAGRVLGYLVDIGGDVHGVDVSPAMIEYCRHAYPTVDLRVGDASTLDDVFGEPFDVIVAANNLIDVFDDTRRREVLAEWHRCLTPSGLLIFSSHNLAQIDAGTATPQSGSRRRLASLAGRVAHKSPAEMMSAARRLPAARRNRRRLSGLQHKTADYAILNDETFDYALLHYYIGRDAQERQLVQAGFELMECLDPGGHQVARGAPGDGPWLHYIAQKSAVSTA